VSGVVEYGAAMKTAGARRLELFGAGQEVGSDSAREDEVQAWRTPAFQCGSRQCVRFVREGLNQSMRARRRARQCVNVNASWCVYKALPLCAVVPNSHVLHRWWRRGESVGRSATIEICPLPGRNSGCRRCRGA